MPEMWMLTPRIISFDVQRFEIELLAAPDAGAGAPTVGTHDLPFHGAILRRAGHALQLGGHVPEVQPGALCDRAFGYLVPIELDRVFRVSRNLPHHDICIRDVFCL